MSHPRTGRILVHGLQYRQGLRGAYVPKDLDSTDEADSFTGSHSSIQFIQEIPNSLADFRGGLASQGLAQAILSVIAQTFQLLLCSFSLWEIPVI